ncbi:MAG: glycosyltransferase family 92 protein [Pseudorhizobium sp.]
MAWFKRAKPTIKNLSIAPPLPHADRAGLAIAVCLKDEESYVAEWVRFHRAVGVCHFIAYDNGSTDDTCSVLRHTLNASELTIVPWAGRVVATKSDQPIDGQVLAFAHAILNFGGRFRRMAFIDADEFLLPMSGTTVEEALAAAGDHPNISLPWHMFGTSGYKEKPAGGVLANYTRRGANPIGEGEPASNFKCIVDPCEVTEVAVHHFKTRQFGELTSNDCGYLANQKARKQSGFYSNKALQLNHYYSKSEAEMRAKMARGWTYAISAARLEEKMQTTLRTIQEDEVEDLAMVRFLRNNGISLDS